MMKHAIVPLCAVVAFALASPAHAQHYPKRKPGLWETQMTTTSADQSAKLQERMANMPPEKRAQMEAYMKQRGMSVGASGFTQTLRYCVTPQESEDTAQKTILGRIERNVARNGQCDEKVSRGASEVRFHAVCHTDEGLSEMDGRVYDLSPVSLAVDLKGKSVKRGEFHMQQKAHWVASDCGNTK